tara:strand:+ start:262 stop:435 length:174 start_codon:yes stop_codon:yes gene_type:complete
MNKFNAKYPFMLKSKTYEKQVVEWLEILQGAEKLDNLTKRLEDFNRDTREIYKDKHL